MNPVDPGHANESVHDVKRRRSENAKTPPPGQATATNSTKNGLLTWRDGMLSVATTTATSGSIPSLTSSPILERKSRLSTTTFSSPSSSSVSSYQSPASVEKYAFYSATPSAASSSSSSSSSSSFAMKSPYSSSHLRRRGTDGTFSPASSNKNAKWLKKMMVVVAVDNNHNSNNDDEADIRDYLSVPALEQVSRHSSSFPWDPTETESTLDDVTVSFHQQPSSKRTPTLFSVPNKVVDGRNALAKEDPGMEDDDDDTANDSMDVSEQSQRSNVASSGATRRRHGIGGSSHHISTTVVATSLRRAKAAIRAKKTA